MKRECVLIFPHGPEAFAIDVSAESTLVEDLKKCMAGPASINFMMGLRFRSDFLVWFYFRDVQPDLKALQAEFQRAYIKQVNREHGKDEPWRESLDGGE